MNRDFTKFANKDHNAYTPRNEVERDACYFCGDGLCETLVNMDTHDPEGEPIYICPKCIAALQNALQK
jgi:hypothetical protein